MDHAPGAEGVAETVAQSRQVAGVGRAHRLRELRLEGQDAPVGQVGDQIDLVVAAGRDKDSDAPTERGTPPVYRTGGVQ